VVGLREWPIWIALRLSEPLNRLLFSMRLVEPWPRFLLRLQMPRAPFSLIVDLTLLELIYRALIKQALAAHPLIQPLETINVLIDSISLGVLSLIALMLHILSSPFSKGSSTPVHKVQNFRQVRISMASMQRSHPAIPQM